MLRNYLKSSVRSLRKRAFFSTLNVAGLALGMAACLLIVQYVVFNLSFDSFHDDPDSIYRVVLGATGDGETTFDAYSYSALAQAIKDQIPEVVETARYHPNFGTATIAPMDGDDRVTSFQDEHATYADPSLFQLFNFPMIAGDAETALERPGTVVLSKSAAEKFFGTTDVIGRTLDFRGWMAETFEVAGVFQDVPANSHLDFDVVVPLNDLLTYPKGQYADQNGWSWTNFLTYVRLSPDANPDSVAAKIAGVVMRSVGDDYRENNEVAAAVLQPIRDIHLYTKFEDERFAGPGYRMIYFFGVIALFILVIAWVNYVNLATSQASERAKEIGVRKASGARRSQVVTQFLTESAVLVGIALASGIALARLARPWLIANLGLELPDTIWTMPVTWIVLALLLVVGTLAVSLYPAFVLSSFHPAAVLKGGGASTPGGDRLRRVLVVMQFAASLSLLVGTWIVYRQVQFMRSQDLGLDVDQVVVVQRPAFVDDSENYARDRAVFVQQLHEIPGIETATISTTIPGGGFNLNTRSRRAGQAPDQGIEIHMSWVSDDFADTYGLKLLAGRALSSEYPVDGEESVVINETAVSSYGFANATDAVGKTVIVGSTSERTIVGVYRDFRWASVKQEEEPVLLGYTTGGSSFSVRLRTTDIAGTLAAIESAFRTSFPGNAFEAYFADGFFDEQYKADRQFGSLFGLFAGLALVIACLGLVGLAAYTVARRTKEVGVRKVLGASSIGVVRLLLKDVVAMVGIAMVLTTPILYFAADKWLQGFATRIPIGPSMFVVPAIALLAIAVAAVGYQAIQIATTDPVKALRYE